MRTDGQTGMMNLIVVICNSANAPKIKNNPGPSLERRYLGAQNNSLLVLPRDREIFDFLKD
jgi:hypothetical protein